MVSGGAFILVLDFSHQGEKVPIPLAIMFCTCSLLCSVSSTDLGQPLLEARMINLEACKLFFFKTTLCHLCCVSVLAVRRFEGPLKYRVWVEEGKTSSFLPNFYTVSFPLFCLKTILSCQISIPHNVGGKFDHKMIKKQSSFSVQGSKMALTESAFPQVFKLTFN